MKLNRLEARKEWLFIFVVLLLNFIFVADDIIDDFTDAGAKGLQVSLSHVGLECVPLVLTAFGMVYIVMRWRALRRISDLAQLQALEAERRAVLSSDEARLWQGKTAALATGISQAIDQQLESWGLSNAEKEISLLMLKGLSLKQIADIRMTSEVTVRQQATKIYSKTGLSGRSELSAFFLEDILSMEPS